MKTYIGVMLAATCMVAVAAAAQEKKPLVEARGNVVPVPLPPGGPPPRLADGHVDLSGVWFSGPTGRANAWSILRSGPGQGQGPGRQGGQGQTNREDPIPYKPEIAAKINNMTEAERQLRSSQVTCRPLGVPGMFTNNPYPHQIVMKPGLFVHLIESNNNWRTVHTDGRPHKGKEDLEPLFNGDETAHWEGDTLVIDSISIDESNWYSDSLHVIERLRRPSLNYLEYQYTIEDPKVLTKPWTSSWRQYSLGSEDLTENFCTNNENVEQLEKLREIESSKSK